MNKYNAKKTVIDGITFDSKREAARYQELKLLERAGEIALLKCQPVFKLENSHTQVAYPNGRVAVYKPDFEYLDKKTHMMMVEDVKSKATLTEAAKLRMAVFEAIWFRRVKVVM